MSPASVGSGKMKVKVEPNPMRDDVVMVIRDRMPAIERVEHNPVGVARLRRAVRVSSALRLHLPRRPWLLFDEVSLRLPFIVP